MGKGNSSNKRQSTSTAFISVFVNKARSQLHSRKKQTAKPQKQQFREMQKKMEVLRCIPGWDSLEGTNKSLV